MKNFFYFCLIFLLTFTDCFADVVNLGSFGTCYKINERDALEEITEQSKNVNFKEQYNKAREDAVKKYRPKRAVHLPNCSESREYKAEVKYTLDYDIHDQYGEVLYPEGYTFNVLDYINLSEQLIVFDIKNNSHINWIIKNKFLENMNAMFVTTSGNAKDLIDFILKFNRKVYFCTDEFVEIFKIESVPSVVNQEENYLKIQSIFIEEGTNEKK